MTPLPEKLSALWSGDLPEAEARELRHRIATEPETALHWKRLCAAMDALDELPVVRTPPPLRSPRSTPARSGAWIAAPLLAAAAAAWWFLPGAGPEMVLVEGSQWVDGEVHLLAGDAVVDVDGKVWVSVEPANGVPRVGVPNVEDPMNKSTLIAGLAGAIVTVVVYEGTAVVRAESSTAPVTVHAGETHHTQLRPPPSDAASTPESRAENIARLQAQLADAEKALAEAQFEGALTRGQLAAVQGTPTPWPSDIPPEIGPERFRAELEAKLADLPDVSVAEVDCTEYPCVAALQYTGALTNDDWSHPIGETVRTWLTGVIGEDMSLSVNTSRFRNGDQEGRYVIFGAHQDGQDSDVGTRVDFRIDGMVDELGERLHDAAPPGE